MQIIWKKATSNLSPDNFILLKPEYDTSTIAINLEFDFTERVFTLHFFTFGDILSIVGGLKASIDPLFTSITPIFVLLFLIQLSYILRDKMELNYRDEHLELLTVARNSLVGLSQALESGELELQGEVRF